LGLIYTLPSHTHERFMYWIKAGLIIYFLYGFWHSRLRKK
jgi:hypothetical protein